MAVHGKFIASDGKDYLLPFKAVVSTDQRVFPVVRDAKNGFVAQCATEALATLLVRLLNGEESMRTGGGGRPFIPSFEEDR